MQVRDGMSGVVLTIGPGHTLRQAARLMAERKVGAAVVIDPESAGPGILTERDILESVAHGQNPDEACASDHLTADTVVASPNWSLEEAAVALISGGARGGGARSPPGSRGSSARSPRARGSRRAPRRRSRA